MFKDFILEDKQLNALIAMIRNMDRGIIVAMDKYGRGTDLRFVTDSHVIINFKPKTLDRVYQMAGRSSRKMKIHMATLICEDPILTDDTIEE